MQLTLVVAMDEAGLIGTEGGLPWRLPADLAHFKRVTMGKSILMGRRTFESIGRALPGRHNIVLSQRPSFAVPGCDVVDTLAAALAAAEPAAELMVIGGAQVYAACLEAADRILLTRVHARFEGETYFPDGAFAEAQVPGWSQRQCEFHPADQRNAFAFSVIEWVR